MKEYNRIVIWADYFDSSLSRSEGRRVPLSKAVGNPNVQELFEVARRLGYSPEKASSAHPIRSSVQSGYVSIEKRRSKNLAIKEFAAALASLKGESKAS